MPGRHARHFPTQKPFIPSSEIFLKSSHHRSGVLARYPGACHSAQLGSGRTTAAKDGEFKMRGHLFSLAVLLLAVSNGFGQNSGTIKGKVTYGEDLPLHDASVSITQTRQSTRTDQNGAFQFTSIPAGRYTVLVHQEGFADATKVITVAAGSEVSLDFQLQIAALREEVTVTASGTQQSVFDSFQSVNSVGSTQITERASTSLGDVLANEPGIAKRSFGPGSSRPVIHGMDGDRVLIAKTGSAQARSVRNPAITASR